ncbi:DUF2752 domain-containing protein [Flagellimonas sp. W118]|uniref:DUF2752 domain-containing protein n=1 Tax=Flagellimonas sp. W118 TaxID=3410791 RepID=UPI003BF51EFB
MEATTKKKYLVIILGVLSFLAILLYFSFNPENGLLFPKCPFYNYAGIYCSGCGTQRAIHDLLHLRFLEAFSHNVLLFPSVFVILQHLTVKSGIVKGRSLLSYRYTPMVILIIVLLFMLLRNLRFYPFEYLAP